MPTEAPPCGQRARTSKAARAQSVTDGVNDGASARSSHASCEHGVVEGGRVRAEVRRLHRARAAARGHREPGARQRRGPAARRRRTRPCRVPSRGRPSRPPPVCRAGVRRGRRRRRRRGRSAASTRRCRRRPWSAGTRRTRGRPASLVALRRARRTTRRASRAAAVRVEGQVREGREDQGAVGADLRRGVLPHRAAEEDGARGVAGQQLARPVRQIDGLDAESGEGAAGRDDRVELLERLDLTVVVVGRMGGARLHPPMLSTPVRAVSPGRPPGPST